MKVVIEKLFPLASTVDAAWATLQDIEAVAGCMPGAQITERIDATHYKGTVTVRVGPATMAFKGVIEVLQLDAASRTLQLAGKGSDSTGTSGASMDLVATVAAADSGCQLSGRSEVAMSGKAAAFGGRMMQTVADQILKQFVQNFAALAESRAAELVGGVDDEGPLADVAVEDASAGSAAAGAIVGANGTIRANAVDTTAATATTRPRAASASPTGSPAGSPTGSPAGSPKAPTPPRANELNGLSLAWAVLRDWLRGLFSRKPA